MGLMYWDGHVLEDEEEDDDRLGSKASELKVVFDKLGKKLPLILDIRLPFWKDLSTPYLIRVLDVNKNSGLYDARLNLTCRMTSLVNNPSNLRSSDVSIESTRHCRRARSIGDLDELLVEYYTSAVAGSGDVMVSPSARFVFDSVNQKSLVENSLFFRLVTLGGARRPFRAASFSISPTKTSRFTAGSPVRIRNSLLQESISELTSPGSQISNLKAFDGSQLVSCSSTCSSPSPPPCPDFSKGLLYFTWKNGSLDILFRDGDDGRKVYTAKSHKVESSVDKAIDYMYTFRSKTVNEAVQYVGKMKVFSSMILDLNGDKSVETEFVLFGVENCSKEVQHSKTKSSKKMVKRLFRSNTWLKHKATSKIDEPSFQLETFFQLDPAFSDESELAVDSLGSGFEPSLELAAVVVRSSAHCCEKEAETGGWGLKFLEKVTELGRADTSIDGHLRHSGASWMSFNVLIPAGVHGCPTIGGGGPSTLTERWRTSGRCDCGGWDIGCPLTILHDTSLAVRKAAHEGDSQESKSSVVELFVEGRKHGEPALRMATSSSEGMCTMYFQPTLSPLQAFMVGVAMVHTQTPALHPKL